MRSLSLFAVVPATFLIAGSAPAWADDPCATVRGFLTAEQIATCLVANKGIRVGEAVPAPQIDLPAVTFEFNSAQLTPQAQRQLDELAKALSYAAFSELPFTIAGHTDALGSDTYNQKLSESRADAVRRYLAEAHAFAVERMSTVGYGKSQLKPNLAPTDADQRRVEIKLNGSG